MLISDVPTYIHKGNFIDPLTLYRHMTRQSERCTYIGVRFSLNVPDSESVRGVCERYRYACLRNLPKIYLCAWA